MIATKRSISALFLATGFCAASLIGLGASPASADTGTWIIGYHTANGIAQNGTATVVRHGNTVEVQISLYSTSSFTLANPNLQVCASTTAFTSKETGRGNCTSTPNGEYSSYDESGSSADETFTLGAPYTNTTGYLQIEVNSLDNGTANTSEVNPQNNNAPIYGNVPTDPAPVVMVGALGLAAGLGGVLYLRQRRHRRAERTA